MKQADVFREGEGDAWYSRNVVALAEKHNDPVLELIQKYVPKPEYIYEIGCSNGWRLEQTNIKWSCKTGGVDPSRDAINIATQHLANVYYGTATRPYGAEGCDVLIYGFCLYLCDPEDYFRIVMEGDRVLKDGGYLIIHDFDARSRNERVPYKHKEGLFSHHVEFEHLWAGHPWYRVLEQQIRGNESFVILKKDSSKAWRNE